MKKRKFDILFVIIFTSLFFTGNILFAQDDEYEEIDGESCIDCHDTDQFDEDIEEKISRSVHEDMECIDCHYYIDVDPHREDTGIIMGYTDCGSCHEDAFEEYKIHGRTAVGEMEDIPTCSDCHGSHDILPLDDNKSKVHPVNLPNTCGNCHENPEITSKYEILINKPIMMYKGSVHGKATKGGIYLAATCNDCHSTNGNAHHIYSPGHHESTINHFNIPNTCGECHKGVKNDYWEGIHGKLTARGETDAPVCTDCHGEHKILSPDNSLSPTSRYKTALDVCSPCHESPILNEKYGLPMGRLATFIDSYHGLKSRTGDKEVANCGSCHGVHRILPSSYESSRVHPNNLQATCSECHEGISAKLAAIPIHGVTSNRGLLTPAADLVSNIYIVAIFIIIGLMVIHWLIDLYRQIRIIIKAKKQVRRMNFNELWQHHLLSLSFTVLVISGFSLRFHDAWIFQQLFGWEGGFELRGLVHRIAAVFFCGAVIWHIIYLFTQRGKKFIKDILPKKEDFSHFIHRILFNLGKSKSTPQFKRFSYVEKAEYWALVWGTAIMIITGFLLWFDNLFINFLPKGSLDVALVVHYYEAWLAFLSIAIWHMYSTIFNPAVYPMNPSWLSGKMPEQMYYHEHPLHIDEAKKDMDDHVKKELEEISKLKKSESEDD